MEPHVSTGDFVDRLIWGIAGGAGASAHTRELEAELMEAKAGQARWAHAAADLYSALLEAGLDEDGKRTPGTPVVAPVAPMAKKIKRRRRQRPPGECISQVEPAVHEVKN